MNAELKIVINESGTTNLRKNSQRTAVLNALFSMVSSRRQRPTVESVIAKFSRARKNRLTSSQVRMALGGLHHSAHIRVVNGNESAWIDFGGKVA